MAETTNVTPNLETIYQPTQRARNLPDEKIHEMTRAMHKTRTQYLRSYGRDMDPTPTPNVFDERVRQNLRLRLKYFCYHVRWICHNIVNLKSLKSRKDLVVFEPKYVEYLQTYAGNVLKGIEKSHAHAAIVEQKPYMADILKWLHILESVMEREYVAPILSVRYLKHIQAMGMALLQPHWALEQEDDNRQKCMMQEASQYVLPTYFNLSTILHVLDIDIHNEQFYKCISLLQRYHTIAQGFSDKTSLYDQYVPFLTEVASFFDLIHELVKDSSSNICIPAFVTTLWMHETRLALDVFQLYRDEL